jgi:hypothetical protein
MACGAIVGCDTSAPMCKYWPKHQGDESMMAMLPYNPDWIRTDESLPVVGSPCHPCAGEPNSWGRLPHPGEIFRIGANCPGLLFQTSVRGFNGAGSCMRADNRNSYGSGPVAKLFGCRGDDRAAPLAISVDHTIRGANTIIAARLTTNATSASQAAYTVYLFIKPPTISYLTDQSPYVGPYAADWPAYLGKLTCGPMQPSNDNPPEYQVDCMVPSPGISFYGHSRSTTLYAMVEVTHGYKPIAWETMTIYLATLPVG